MSYDNWQSRNTIDNNQRTNGMYFSIGGYAYWCGGIKNTNSVQEVWKYDISGNSWSQQGSTCPLFSGTITKIPSVVAGGYAYMVGIALGNASFYQYDPSNDTWTQKANYTGAGTYVMSAVGIGNDVYAGFGRSGIPLTEWYQWDYVNNQWNVKASGTAGIRSGCFTINGKGYRVGGQRLANAYSVDVFEYDPNGNSWSTKASFPNVNGVDSMGSCSTSTRGYILGGISNYSSPTTLDTLYEYEPTGNQWTQRQSISGARMDPGLVSDGLNLYGGYGRVAPASTIYNDWYMWDGTPYTPPPGFEHSKKRKFDRLNNIRETTTF